MPYKDPEEQRRYQREHRRYQREHKREERKEMRRIIQDWEDKKNIIIETEDGFHIAEFSRLVPTEEGKRVDVYKSVEYYHTLKDALEEV